MEIELAPSVGSVRAESRVGLDGLEAVDTVVMTGCAVDNVPAST